MLRILYIHTVSLESLHLSFKKSHQKPLGTFKDLSICRDRQREANLFFICDDDTHHSHFIPEGVAKTV
jgi:hypothetical protein